MDQSLVAGVGNIYRAEILYKARALFGFPWGGGFEGGAGITFLRVPGR